MQRGRGEPSGQTLLENANPPGASTRSRRALGDVSNKDSKKASSQGKGKPTTEGQLLLRRSRRLSNEKTQEPNPADESAHVPTQQLNASTSIPVSTKPSVQPPPEVDIRSHSDFAHPTRGAKKRAVPKSNDEGNDTKRPAHGAKEHSKSSQAQKLDLLEPRQPYRRTRSRSQSFSGEDTTPYLARWKLPPIPPPKVPCPEVLDGNVHELQRESFSPNTFTQGIAPYDISNEHDVQEVPKYVTDIFQRLYDAEKWSHPHPYMDRQMELNGMMRSILVDWIVEVHMKFRLLPETLYLCVNIIDRYLSCVPVQRNRLQLVGVTALLIACKYEEIYPPEVKDCVYITDRAYTRQEVLDMEAHIVKVLKFTLTVPTGHPFLQRFLHVTQATTVVRCLASYYLERMLQEHSALQFKPSVLAATAVALALSNPTRLDYEGLNAPEQPTIPKELLEYSGFQPEEIICAAEFVEAKVGDRGAAHGRRELVAVRRKYESSRYESVSISFDLPKANHLRFPIG